MSSSILNPQSTIWQTVDSFQNNYSSPRLSEERPCPICASPRYRTFSTLHGLQYYSDSADVPKRFDLSEAQCLECACIFQNPSYSDYGFQILLAEAGCSYGASPGRDDETIAWLQRRNLLRSGTCLLDAGCFDIRKIGVDIDEPALQRARQDYARENTEFILGEFESFQCENKPDVVLMLHVLEHLGRPVSALRNLRNISHSKTVLILEVPLLELGFTNDINGSLPPLHLTHFTRASLYNCMAAGGWEIQEFDEQKDYNGFRVIATPLADAASPALLRDDAATGLLYEHLSRWYQAMGHAENQLRAFSKFHKWVIWGAGFHTEMLYHFTSLFRHRERQFVLVDMDPLKQHKTWRGIPVQPPSILQALDWTEAGAFIPSSYQHHQAIRASALDLGVPPDRIVSLYETVRIR
jgi:hypothetical protein